MTAPGEWRGTDPSAGERYAGDLARRLPNLPTLALATAAGARWVRTYVAIRRLPDAPADVRPGAGSFSRTLEDIHNLPTNTGGPNR
jgi:hypothetical protein